MNFKQGILECVSENSQNLKKNNIIRHYTCCAENIFEFWNWGTHMFSKNLSALYVMAGDNITRGMLTAY
jgi:hypothetical protein